MIVAKKDTELFFSTCKFLKVDQYETERQREQRLNQIIRKPLLAKFADPKDPSNPPHIIVSRAYKYIKQVIKHSLSTTEIESVLNPSSEHLEHVQYSENTNNKQRTM